MNGRLAARLVMRAEVVSVGEHMDQEAVSRIFAQHDLLSIPVVDAEGRMKGGNSGSQASTLVIRAMALGEVWRSREFLPYGEDDPSFTRQNSFDPKYRFNFKEREKASGLYDYGARMYDPATGRWISPDTVTTDGLNRYAYVSNNPVRYVDPTGHFQQEGKPRILSEEEKKARNIQVADDTTAILHRDGETVSIVTANGDTALYVNGRDERNAENTFSIPVELTPKPIGALAIRSHPGSRRS